MDVYEGPAKNEKSADLVLLKKKGGFHKNRGGLFKGIISQIVQLNLVLRAHPLLSSTSRDVEADIVSARHGKMARILINEDLKLRCVVAV